MKDYIVTATAADAKVRAFAAATTSMVEYAQKIHQLSPTGTAALGRTLTAAAIMSRMLKGPRDTLTIQIKGDGPLGGIIAVTDTEANVRGYVYNPEVDLPLNQMGKIDVSGAIGGEGYLNVIKDLGLKEPYIGYVNLVSGEIAEDIAYYFTKSEQVPSAVALGVLVDRDWSVISAGGFIIQLLPGAGEEIIEHLEEKLKSIPPVTTLLYEGKTPEQILELLLGEKGLEVLEKSPCEFFCNCSRERMERNLLSLGRKEIADIIQEQHGAELQCHFCNSKYDFSEDELMKLIDSDN